MESIAGYLHGRFQLHRPNRQRLESARDVLFGCERRKTGITGRARNRQLARITDFDDRTRARVREARYSVASSPPVSQPAL